MKKNTKKIALLLLIILCGTGVEVFAQAKLPFLEKKHGQTRLIVDGQHFLVLGGELGNSSFTSLEYMEPQWGKLKSMHLNTILAPVYWELIEPVEGSYDFELLDELILETRRQGFKLILLWFGSWKNSMSSHVPSWVKTNPQKYSRAIDERGESHELLSPFCEANRNADKKAFTALMKHVRDYDKDHHTIIMIQPENEIGMLPSARDYHPQADTLFKQDVPKALMDYLQSHKEELVPEFLTLWKQNGYKIKGSWEQVFGQGYKTDELFMAWYFALYVNDITKAGKAVYPLPMFVNAALIRPGKIPGEYPSAGPLPHLMDIWKAGAPDIDMLSPDFYNPDFEYWNSLYVRQGNPLFIPEHRFDKTVGVKALYAFGHFRAIGFSPFSVESKTCNDLTAAYQVLNQLQPVISANFGNESIDGVLLDKNKPLSTVVLGDYEFSFKNSYTLGWEAGAENEVWDSGGAIIIQTAENEFYIAGSGIVVTFKNWKRRNMKVGILSCEEGYFSNGQWKVIRHLNGDQTHQGRHVRISHGDFSIQKVQLYEY